MNLVDIQRQCWNDTARYFPLGFPPDHVQYLAVALAGEVGEVCNEIKKNMRGDFPMATLEEKLSLELPDVLIYLVLLAEAMDIDLAGAYTAKREVNNDKYARRNSEA